MRDSPCSIYGSGYLYKGSVMRINLLAIGICIVAYFSPSNIKLRAQLWWMRRVNNWMEHQTNFYRAKKLLLQQELNRKLKMVGEK